MGNERIYRTEGIVIRRRNQGEADRILTLCTPLGKLDVIAKGARKLRSRKAGHIELFCRSSFVIARSHSSWDIISHRTSRHGVASCDLIDDIRSQAGARKEDKETPWCAIAVFPRPHLFPISRLQDWQKLEREPLPLGLPIFTGTPGLDAMLRGDADYWAAYGDSGPAGDIASETHSGSSPDWDHRPAARSQGPHRKQQRTVGRS